MATRYQSRVFLLESTISELTGNKLPSLRMVLRLFLHHHIDLKETIRASSAFTVGEVSKFWQKARIPMRDQQNCQTKLKSFEEWRLLKKNRGRQTTTQKGRENAFISSLDDLFDVAHADALNMITIDEDKELLIAQREKGRRRSMAGLDTKNGAKEKRAAERHDVVAVRRQRMEESCDANNATVVLESSISGSDESDATEAAASGNEKQQLVEMRSSS